MRVAHYCPVCGAPTVMMNRFGKSRPVCTQCDTTVFFEPKVAVVVFVTDDDRVLLVERLFEPSKGTWSLPAGFAEPEEAPTDAAMRETREETGLDIEITGLIDVLHRPDPDGLADIVIVYGARVNGGILNAGDDAAAVGWFTRDALPPLSFRTTELMIARWDVNGK